MAQSVKRLTSPQVVISRSVGSSPMSGSVLTAQSVEPVSDSVSSPLSAPPPLMLCFFLSKINIKKSFKKILFFKFFNIYLFLKETEHEWGRGIERGRDRT